MKGMADDRMIFYGLRYIIETYLHRRWTEADIDQVKQKFFFFFSIIPHIHI
jgi:hypothetical protein